MHEQYYAHENRQAGAHKAVVHRGSCGNCKHGQGKTTGTNPQYGRWHCSLNSLSSALGYARALPGVVNVKTYQVSPPLMKKKIRHKSRWQVFYK